MKYSVGRERDTVREEVRSCSMKHLLAMPGRSGSGD